MYAVLYSNQFDFNGKGRSSRKNGVFYAQVLKLEVFLWVTDSLLYFHITLILMRQMFKASMKCRAKSKYTIIKGFMRVSYIHYLKITILH